MCKITCGEEAVKVGIQNLQQWLMRSRFDTRKWMLLFHNSECRFSFRSHYLFVGFAISNWLRPWKSFTSTSSLLIILRLLLKRFRHVTGTNWWLRLVKYTSGLKMKVRRGDVSGFLRDRPMPRRLVEITTSMISVLEPLGDDGTFWRGGDPGAVHHVSYKRW